MSVSWRSSASLTSEHVDALDRRARSESRAISIQRFIESRPTTRASAHCSRTSRCRSGWMLARKRTSAALRGVRELGLRSRAKTLSCVSWVWRLLRSYSYSPDQKKVLPPCTCSMSSTLTPRARSTSYSASPKSSPTGPTTRTSSRNEAASAKCTAEPPSMRSRSPHGVLTASKAIDPTTVTLMRARKGTSAGSPPGAPTRWRSRPRWWSRTRPAPSRGRPRCRPAG